MQVLQFATLPQTAGGNEKVDYINFAVWSKVDAHRFIFSQNAPTKKCIINIHTWLFSLQFFFIIFILKIETIESKTLHNDLINNVK